MKIITLIDLFRVHLEDFSRLW